MSIVVARATQAPVAGRTCAPAMVDCKDERVGDLVALWLARAGYEVGAVPEAAARGDPNAPPLAGVLITDRLGPQDGRQATIASLRERSPRLQIVFVDPDDEARGERLALARVVGAHATLDAPLSKDRVIATVRRLLW
jgi:DNA-binding NtrC family response regulator